MATKHLTNYPRTATKRGKACKEILNDAACRTYNKAGRYADGGNLYLLVKPDGRKSWVFRFVDPVTGKRQDMGLGRYGKHYVTLAKAREAAADARGLLSELKNPIEERKLQLREAQQAHAKRLTFKQCADKYIDMNRAKWRNSKHAQQWENTLATHAAELMPMPVADIDTDMVEHCLEKIWHSKTETASRVRQRIEAVLAWATVKNLRHGPNPAKWVNNLDKVFPSPSDLKKVVHRAALPYPEAGAFMPELRAKDSMSAKALELQILTATRPGEVCAAQWDEFQLTNATINIVGDDKRTKVIKVPGLWTIPAERMKAGKEHTIPLSQQAVNLLKSIPHIEGSPYVFAGRSLNKPMSTAAGMKLLKELRPGLTQHGMRSTFRDWAGETTAYPREVVEMAMAHQLKDKAEAAYARGNLIDKRRRLMRDWADYCDMIQTQQADNVTPIRKKL